MDYFLRKNYTTTDTVQNKGVIWIEHKIFHQFPEIRTAYSSRIGGVSTGVCASMNLRNCEWDSTSNYKKNMEIFCEAAGFVFNRIVASNQTHTTNVAIVKEPDIPRGTLFDRQYNDIDGLVTNVPEAVLVTSFADCIPLYFYDSKNKAIGICHSGWKGTLGRIGLVTLDTMRREYGTDPENVFAAIGPGICVDCYEVSKDLYESFSKDRTEEELKRIFLPGREGHYQMNLWEANLQILKRAGIPENHISITDICTKCNHETLFSHRAMGNRRGNQCGFMMINK